jgi:hypothetical protein
MDARLYWASACPASARTPIPSDSRLKILRNLALTPAARRERRAGVALRLNTTAFSGSKQPLPGLVVRQRRLERLADEFGECAEVIHRVCVTLFGSG